MISTKKHEEGLVTEMFLNKLNEKYGTSYKMEAVFDENTKIDTRGISAVLTEHHIDFQVTYADNGLPHEGGGVLGKHFRPSGKNVIDLTTPYDIAAAIARKQERYSKEEAADLVLLIWKTKSCLIVPDGQDWNVESIWFNGCFFVCLEGGGTPGQIVTLKPYVAQDGTTYEL